MVLEIDNLNQLISMTVAIVGCITGCSSLIISFYRAKFESGHLRIRTSKYHNHFFKRLPVCNCYTKYQAIIWIEIVNDAPHPTTIYDIDIKLSDGHYKPFKCPVSEIVLETIPENGVSSKTIEDMSNHLTLPLTIEPFNVYQGYIFLEYFPFVVDSTERFYMKIHATQKDKILRGKIKKWNN